MSLALGIGLLCWIKKKKKKAQPSDHKHVLPQPQAEATAAQRASLPPSFSLFQHIPLSTSFLPHPLNFNTCLSCFLLFFFLFTSPLLHQTLAAYLVITRALRKPFHLKDWQLSQWNTIKWLPLKRKGKFELRYAAACRTALLLKWEQRWRSCRRCIFFFSPFCPPPQIFDNQRGGWETTWVKRWCFIARDLFLLVVKSPLLKYGCSLN